MQRRTFIKVSGLAAAGTTLTGAAMGKGSQAGDKTITAANVNNYLRSLKVIDQKKQWINDNGLVIIRCHDVLDNINSVFYLLNG